MTTDTPTRDYKLISADGHLTEPRDLWSANVPAKWLDRVPHVEHRSDGDYWVAPGSRYPVMQIKGDLLPGSYDPKARLDALDEDGVDAEVLYPNSGPDFARASEDPDFHLAMVRLYNDFLADFCAVAPDRFGGCPLLPEVGIDAALAEIDRLQDKPGIVAWMLRAYPHGSNVISEEDDPVWEAIVDTGKPATMHIGLRPTDPGNMLASPLPGTLHFDDAPRRMLEIMFSGILDTYPTLDFFLAEIDCGWLPYFSQSADDNYLRRTRQKIDDAWQTKRLARLPSEYMKERFPASFITDPFAVQNRYAVGVERMLWSSDYPHPTTDWPHSWKIINATFWDVPDDERHAILAGNARRLFGWGNEV